VDVSNTSQALQRRESALQRKQGSLAQAIEKMKPEIARALPKHLDPDRVARIATTVMRRTPKLADCTQDSFLGALMTCAQLGLEPGPLGHAYLVPYKQECTFIVGYRGMIELARRSGQVKQVYAKVVRQGDEFEYSFGLEPTLTHKPAGDIDRDITHAYAVLHLRDGVEFEVMTRAEIERVRARSRAAQDGPWVTDFAEMAKKTVLRRLLKTAPMSVEYHTAMAVDERPRVRLDPDALDLGSVPIVDGDDVEGELVDDVVPDDAAGMPEQEWPATAQPGGGQP
jgi:recombination protein RecT